MAATPTDADASPGPRHPEGFGVNVVGLVTTRMGMGVAARATIAALLDAGVPVAIADIDAYNGRAGADRSYAHLEVADRSRLPYPVTLVHMNPLEARPVWRSHPQWFTDTFTCLVPFTETSDPRRDWAAELPQYDAVLAPTQHIAAAFSGSATRPVRLFPLATTVAQIAAVTRADFGIPEDRPAFAAGWDTYSGFARKGGLAVLRAFEAALAFGVDATLVIKLNNNGPRRHPQLERALKRLPRERVVVVDGYLPYERVLGLYSLCDAYISLHRAEGLGLGMQEAMLLGKPVIATGWSGNMDFMDSSCASIVAYSLTPMIDDNPEYVSTNFSRAQFWAEPDVLDAARRIQHLAEDPGVRQALGRAAQRRALAYHAAWKRSAPEVLVELYRESVEESFRGRVP